MSELENALRVPFTLTIESLDGGDGQWQRRVSYSAVDGCSIDGIDLAEMIDEVERQRVRTIASRVEHGEQVRGNGPTLRHSTVLLTDEELDSALGRTNASPATEGKA